MAPWWQEQAIYQIYPRSFQDTDSDGIGDIPGIIAHLDDLHDLGVGGLWLSPVYRSPGVDNGYDISGYKDINPEFGTLADMDRLIAEAGRRGIKIIMDLVINHTSDQHPWFIASRDKDSAFRDYYIWRPGRSGGRPPNNWSAFFGGSCWQYDERSGEYYLHLFDKRQPDLNWRNPRVMDEVMDILRFWLNRGVAGFRCDVINILYKQSLDDGRWRLALTGIEHYLSREGTHEILRTLRREIFDPYGAMTVGETVFVDPAMARQLCGRDRGELDMVFSFEHMETDQFFIKWFKRPFRSRPFARALVKWQRELAWNANYLENHDQTRCVSRFGDDGEYWAPSAKLLCVLLLTLRGTPFIYEGQELGMTNFDITGMDGIRDVESFNVYELARRLHFPAWLRWRIIRASSRDNARTPMQWTAGANAGFTDGNPWIAVNANHIRINYAAQKGDPHSILSFYKTMLALRKGTPALIHGDFTPLKITGRLFAYARTYEGRRYIVVLNFSDRPLKAAFDGKLVVSNYQRREYPGKLEPWEAVILQAKEK